MRLKAAVNHGQLPTFTLLSPWHTLPKKFVHHINQLLLRAWEQLKMETCGKCGGFAWRTHYTDPENYLQHKIETTVCGGCEAMDEDQAKRTKEKAATVPGESRYPVAHMLEFPGVPVRKLPTRSEWKAQEQMLWEHDQKVKLAKKLEAEKAV